MYDRCRGHCADYFSPICRATRRICRSFVRRYNRCLRDCVKKLYIDRICRAKPRMRRCFLSSYAQYPRACVEDYDRICISYLSGYDRRRSANRLQADYILMRANRHISPRYSGGMTNTQESARKTAIGTGAASAARFSVGMIHA